MTHANGFSYINTCQLRHLRDPAYQRRAAGPSRLALKIIDHATVETTQASVQTLDSITEPTSQNVCTAGSAGVARRLATLPHPLKLISARSDAAAMARMSRPHTWMVKGGEIGDFGGG